MGFFDGGAGGMIGGVLGYIGGRQANDANRDMAHNANVMSQENAREQMAFQERMSNTSHAREVADLKSAGLNPILSMNQGAATPGGASGGTTAGHAENAASGLAASAQEFANLKLQQKRQSKESEVMDSQKGLNDSLKTKADVDAKVASKGIPEADIKNKAYDLIRPLLDKLSKGHQSNSSPEKVPKPSRNYNLIPEGAKKPRDPYIHMPWSN